MRASAGNLNRESKLGKEREPQRIVFVNVQNARNTDNTHRRVLRFKRLILERPLILIVKQVRHLLFRLFKTRASLAAVTRYKLTAVRELCYCKLTVVVALLAARKTCFKFKLVKLVLAQYIAFAALPAFLCDNSRTERAHNTRNIGSYNLLARK